MPEYLTNSQFWKDKWESVDQQEWDDGSLHFVPEWHRILRSTLQEYNGGSCLEVGCFPGRYLNYFARTYDMSVEGVDLMRPSEECNLHINCCDFFEFKSDSKFDVVCSFGFIEHFEDFADVIRHHIDLANDNGVVVITVPNFVHGWRYRSRRKLDQELFVHHNKRAMDITCLRNALKEVNVKDCKVLPLRFSYKEFGQVSGLKRIAGKILANLSRLIPVVDRGLSTEILIVIKK